MAKPRKASWEQYFIREEMEIQQLSEVDAYRAIP